MKNVMTVAMLAAALAMPMMGCAKKGDTKDDAEVTEGSREIQPATSGGMQRMEEEEEAAAPDEETPAAAVEDEPAPE